jgi:hypothetical protein
LVKGKLKSKKLLYLSLFIRLQLIIFAALDWMLLPEVLEVMIRSKVLKVLASLSLLPVFSDLPLSTKNETESARTSGHSIRVWMQGRNFEPELAGLLFPEHVTSLWRHLKRQNPSASRALATGSSIPLSVNKDN